MRWIETTGRTLDDAKEAALDLLGVAEDEAEFEIVEEAQTGLFGRVRREARVRARVRPVQPRPKVDRRRARRSGRRPKRRREQSSSGESGEGTAARGGVEDTAAAATDARPASEERAAAEGSGSGAGPRSRSRRRRRRRDTTDTDVGQRTGTEGKGKTAMSDVSLEEQTEIVRDFADGLVEAFGFDADVEAVTLDEEQAEVQITGDDLGLLIGPHGQTLQAIQSLSRTVVQRVTEGRPSGRVTIDVDGYRQRRKEALERFVEQLAAEVRDSGVEKGLEPMGAADRKVVHDAVNAIDGVTTISEGEDPRRRVVIVPESD